MKDNLHTGQEVREKLMAGIRKCADAVGATMGTGGSNSLIEAIESPGHMTTNDGATILNAIKLADPIEEMGRKILMEAVSRANRASGDGSSTTTILTAAILEEGIKHFDKASPMEVKRSLEECIPVIEQSLNRQKRMIEVSEVGQVAAISAEDAEIGDLIQEIYEKIGKEGVIHWDVSKTSEDIYTIGTGLTVEGAVLASPYMADQDKTTGQFGSAAKLKEPFVIITREKITTGAVFEQLFMQLNAKGKKEVVVFCDDFDVNVVAQFVMTHQVQGFRTILVKLPVIWGDQWRQDLALASGATIIDPTAGLSLKDIKQEHLGTFGHLAVDKEATHIDGIKDLTVHIKTLENDGTDESLNRAARLNTRTARLFLGAHSDSALSYKRLKVEDAIAAAYHALNGGVVAGGGTALRNVSLALPDTIGARILEVALCAPQEQIAKNSGYVYKDTMSSGTKGLDTRTGQIVDMFEAGITDPATIVLNAAKNAISVAASILTTKTLVTFPREEIAPQNPNALIR